MIMKTKRIKCFTFPIFLGVIWFMFGIFSYGIEVLGKGDNPVNILNSETNVILTFICCHILFSIIFVFSSIISFKKYNRIFNGDQSIAKMEKEIDLKMKWEQFQYDLHKQEREEKTQYDQLEKVLAKINSSPVDDNYTLKTEFIQLKEAFEELKKEKDQKIYVEILNQVKRKSKE
jgi:hypothetical protein